MIMNDKLLNIVAFCILMENDEGIINKSPDYIMEKYNRYCGAMGDEHKWGLDGGNTSKLERYKEIWKI